VKTGNEGTDEICDSDYENMVHEGKDDNENETEGSWPLDHGQKTVRSRSFNLALSPDWRWGTNIPKIS
jgi:hypothetical protein